MKKHLSIVLGIGLIFIQCSKNDDAQPDQIDPPGTLGPDITVQNFMWQTMNTYYFWQADVADLGDSRFTSEAKYREFLESEEDPGKFFDEKLLFREDRFSFYSDDYKELTKAFAGVSKSNGLEFGLSLFA